MTLVFQHSDLSQMLRTVSTQQLLGLLDFMLKTLRQKEYENSGSGREALEDLMDNGVISPKMFEHFKPLVVYCTTPYEILIQDEHTALPATGIARFGTM